MNGAVAHLTPFLDGGGGEGGTDTRFGPLASRGLHWKAKGIGSRGSCCGPGRGLVAKPMGMPTDPRRGETVDGALQDVGQSGVSLCGSGRMHDPGWQWAHARPGVEAGSLATAPQRQAATDSVPPIYEISRRVRGGQAPTDSAEMILSIYAWEEARGRRSLPLSCRLPCFPSSPCTCRNACNWPAKWRGGL